MYCHLINTEARQVFPRRRRRERPRYRLSAPATAGDGSGHGQAGHEREKGYRGEEGHARQRRTPPPSRRTDDSVWCSMSGLAKKVARDKMPPGAILVADSLRAQPANAPAPNSPGANVPIPVPAPASPTPAPATATPTPAAAVDRHRRRTAPTMELGDAKIRLEDARHWRNRYGVEIQKKFSLAAACIVFVLVGAPIALRFPRGGVGLVIGVSFLVFAIYYIGLIGGESLANHNIISPFWAMWADNVDLPARRPRAHLAHGPRGRDDARRQLRGDDGQDQRMVHPDARDNRMKHIFRPLDRYVLTEFAKIFVGDRARLPDPADRHRSHRSRSGISRASRLPTRDIALSYLFWIPDSMFMVLPAAVLFATVFSIGGFTRHSEVTAAKASGISFYRLIMPILVGAVLACGLDLGPRRVRADQQRAAQPAVAAKTRRRSARCGSTSRSPANRGASTRHPSCGPIRGAFEACRSSGRDRARHIRRTSSPRIPRRTTRAGRRWTLRNGRVERRHRHRAHVHRVVRGRRGTSSFTEQPLDMMAKARDPHDMRYERALAVHHRARALGRRRQRAARRARAQDRHSGHLHHHRAVRRPARDEHAARRLGLRNRREPCHDDDLSAHDSAHQGDRRQGAHPARPRGMDSRRGVRAR